MNKMKKLIQSAIIILGLVTAATTFVRADNELGTVAAEEQERITLGTIKTKNKDTVVANFLARGRVTGYEDYSEELFRSGAITFQPIDGQKSYHIRIDLLTPVQQKALRDAYANNSEIILSFVKVSALMEIYKGQYPSYITAAINVDPKGSATLTGTKYAATDLLPEIRPTRSLPASMTETFSVNRQDKTTHTMEGIIASVHRDGEHAGRIGVDEDTVINCTISLYNPVTGEQKFISIASESMSEYAEKVLRAPKGGADIKYTYDASYLPSIIRWTFDAVGLSDYPNLLSMSVKDASQIGPDPAKPEPARSEPVKPGTVKPASRKPANSDNSDNKENIRSNQVPQPRVITPG